MLFSYSEVNVKCPSYKYRREMHVGSGTSERASIFYIINYMLMKHFLYLRHGRQSIDDKWLGCRVAWLFAFV